MRIFGRRFRTDRPRVVSDDAVLDATVRLVARDPATSLADISRRVRLDERQMRERFTSIDHLVDLAVMRGARRIARSAFVEDGTPAQQIALLVARLWDDQYPVARLSLRAAHGPVREDVEVTLAPVRELVADAVTRGAAEGTLRTDTPADTVAWLIQQTLVLCLEEGLRAKLAPRAGREFAMRQTLSVAGLSWETAGEVVESVRQSLRP